MDKHGNSFVIMVKGMNDLVSSVVSSLKGTFENKRVKQTDDYDVYGTTVKRKLFETDAKERYFHIYHSTLKENSERTRLAKHLGQIKSFLMCHTNEVIEFGSGISRYFVLHYSGGMFHFSEERTDVIKREKELSGYFCIITSEKMTAKDAINLYKNRDASEKLFCEEKTFLGDKDLQVYGDSFTDAKTVIEFIALIIRNRIYNCLQEEMKAMGKRGDFMTVPKAIRELEKIEMIRLTDNRYRLDHGVTETQKMILKAFGMDVGAVKYYAGEIGRIL